MSPNLFSSDLVRADYSGEEIFNQLFDTFNKAQKSNMKQAELAALMDILEHSFILFEEHLIIDFFDYCESLCYELNDGQTLARLYHLLSAIYYKQTDFDKAIRFYIKSARFSNQAGDYLTLSRTYGLVAQCYIVQRKFDQAMFYLKTAEWVYKEHDLHSDSLKIHLLYFYSQLYIRSGELETARIYIERLTSYLDSPILKLEKALIHRITSLFFEKQRNYVAQFENLQQAAIIYEENGNLNQHLKVLEQLINCPAPKKTSSMQTSYVFQHNMLRQKIFNANKGFSFHAMLQQFYEFRLSQSTIENTLNERSFFLEAQENEQQISHLIIISLNSLVGLKPPEINEKYELIADYFRVENAGQSFIIYGFFHQQLVVAFNNSSEEEIAIHFPQLFQNVSQIVGETRFGLATKNPNIQTIKQLYNQAYAQLYYNLHH